MPHLKEEEFTYIKAIIYNFPEYNSKIIYYQILIQLEQAYTYTNMIMFNSKI